MEGMQIAFGLLGGLAVFIYGMNMMSGCLLFIWFVNLYAAFIQSISPSGPEVEVISCQIANAHTIFNITMICVWVGLINKVMVPIVMRIVPEGEAKVSGNPMEPQYLDSNIISQPSAALQLVEEMYHNALSVMETGSKEDVKAIFKKKILIRDLDISMRKAHMSRVSKGKCAANLTVPYNKLLHIIDRMGNNCVNIADTALKKVNLQYFTALEA